MQTRNTGRSCSNLGPSVPFRSGHDRWRFTPRSGSRIVTPGVIVPRHIVCPHSCAPGPAVRCCIAFLAQSRQVAGSIRRLRRGQNTYMGKPPWLCGVGEAAERAQCQGLCVCAYLSSRGLEVLLPRLVSLVTARHGFDEGRGSDGLMGWK